MGLKSSLSWDNQNCEFPTAGVTSSHPNKTQERKNPISPHCLSGLSFSLLGFSLSASLKQSIVVGKGGSPSPCRNQAPLVLSLGCISESEKAVNEL